MNDEQMIWETYSLIYENINQYFNLIDSAVIETKEELETLSKKYQLNVKWNEDEYEDDNGELIKTWNMIYLPNEDAVRFDDESQYQTIYQTNNGEFYIDSNPYFKYKTLEDAKSSAEELLLQKLIDSNIGSYGINIENNRYCYRIFEAFPKRINDIIMKDGWFITKWGSWYLEAKILHPNNQEDYIDTIKLSVRDHEQKSMSHQIPDKSFYVSKNWEPEEVGSALKKCIEYLNNL